MSDTKILAVFVIILTGFGLYLHSQDKLIPTVQAITKPSETGVKTFPIGAFAIAFITYLFILSFLDTREGIILTALVVTGALFYNQKTMGKDSLLSLLLTKTKGG